MYETLIFNSSLTRSEITSIHF